ncbi:MAG: hypothetical protein QOH31_1894, partial [Verrucomicrobiota bacterium]
FFSVSDFANKFDKRILQQRPYFGLEVVAIY